MSAKNEKPDTKLLHGAWRPASLKDLVPPIQLATVFEHDPKGYGHQKYGYSRSNNPNREQLETLIADLEGGAQAFAFSSGMAAVQSVLELVRFGGRVLIPSDVYHGSRALFKLYEQKKRIELHQYATESALTDLNTADLVWVETPSNPMLNLTDIAEIRKHAGPKPIICVDNTWMTPLLQQPLMHGADLVLHSSTKYLGGHSDLLGGLVISATDFSRADELRQWQITAGAVPSPFDCWMMLRSLKTLDVRLQRQMQNAIKLASWLNDHVAVSRVYFPGLSEDLIKPQMKGPGAMISFEVKGSEQQTLEVVSASSLILRATSLGGVESTWEHRRSTEGDGSETPASLIRLSVGIENVDDLTDDIEQALTVVG